MLAQPANMNHWLNAGSERERIDKLVLLGVEHEAAELAVDKRNIEWRHIRSESGNERAVMFFPCESNVFGARLYILQSSDKGWRVTDDTALDCHYDNSVSIEIASARNPNVDDILAHHDCVEHGGGYVQHFNVFAVNSGKLITILDTEEVIEEGSPSYFRLRSTFAVLSATQSASHTLQETQCVNNHGKISVQRRRFSWNESAFLLVPTHFVKVPLADGKMTAGCR